MGHFGGPVEDYLGKSHGPGAIARVHTFVPTWRPILRRAQRRIGVGMALATPPSEPYRRFSRIRLSSRQLSASGLSR